MLIITVVYKVIESLHLANDNVHLPTVSSIAEQQSEGGTRQEEPTDCW
jgi:hypothetical protein